MPTYDIDNSLRYWKIKTADVNYIETQPHRNCAKVRSYDALEHFVFVLVKSRCLHCKDGIEIH